MPAEGLLGWRKLKPVTSGYLVWIESIGLAFVSILLLLATVIVPLLSLVTLPLLPAIITLHSFRRGYSFAVIVVLIISAFLFLTFNWIVALFLSLLTVFGLALRPLIEKKTNPSLVVLSCWSFVFLLLVTLNSALFYQTKVSFIESEKKAIAGFMREQRQILKDSGRPANEYEPQLKLIEETFDVVPYLFPAALALFSLWLAWSNFQAVNALLSKLRFPFLTLPPVNTWQFPWYFSWGYLLALIGVVLSRVIKVNSFAVSVFSGNLLVFFGFIFMLQGLAVVLFFLDRFKVKALSRLVFLILAFLAHLLFQILTLLGLFDTWFDYRRLSHPVKD